MALKYNPISNSYVVFTKVSEAIWKKMTDDQKQSHILYFVVDGNNDDVGKLYLGSTLIADGSGVTKVSFDDLDDVYINAIQNDDVLMYNIDELRWENVNLRSYLGDIFAPFTGATQEKDGLAGLVPQPLTTDINKYLKGDGSWGDPVAQVSQDLSDLQAVVSTLVGGDADKSVRVIAEAVAANAADEAVNRAIATIVAEAPEKFDTLKEIADWISGNSDVTSVPGMITSIETLNAAVFNEETGLEAVNAKLVEALPKITALEGKVINFETSIGDLQADLIELDELAKQNKADISDILSRLVWQELVEEE